MLVQQVSTEPMEPLDLQARQVMLERQDSQDQQVMLAQRAFKGVLVQQGRTVTMDSQDRLVTWV